MIESLQKNKPLTLPTLKASYNTLRKTINNRCFVVVELGGTTVKVNLRNCMLAYYREKHSFPSFSVNRLIGS